MPGLDSTRVLAIAGWDPSGAAGLARDLATFHKLGADPAGVISSIAPQHARGVEAVMTVDEDFFELQIRTVCADTRFSAWKVGLLPTGAHAETVLRVYEESERPPLVVDPVLRSGDGGWLSAPEAVPALRELAAAARVLTPNLVEAQTLVADEEGDLAPADLARRLAPAGGWCVVTGGDIAGEEVVDRASDGTRVVEFARPRVKVGWVRGTGCAMSSALAVGLARGEELPQAIAGAGDWLRRQLTQATPAPEGGAGRLP